MVHSPTGKNSDRVKIAMIPVLMVALGVVFFMNRDGVESHPSLQPATAQAPVSAPDTGSRDHDSESAKHAVRWPDIELAETLSRNPFAPPQSLSKPALVNEEAAPSAIVAVPDAASLQESMDTIDLQAIYQTKQGPVALIGSRIVRIGDPVGNRLRVSDIRVDGVVLELLDE